MPSSFLVREHVADAQHIREYARATARSQEAVLHLAVKQYVPVDNINPQEGDVTFVAAHANGFPKELYEPLWEDLLAESRKKSFKIRSIWIADVAPQGQSGVMNEDELGNDPSWLDDARDLLHLTNVFRAEMPRPIVGIAHSFGANVLVHLSHMHPRLLTGLVLIDPVLSVFTRQGRWHGFSLMKASSVRRDLWPSREEAADALARNKAYASWDRRCLALLVEHAFRDTPTKLYPNAPDGSVTLTTTKHHEVVNYYRPIRQRLDPSTGERTLDRSLVPDAGPDDIDPTYPFYRPEGLLALSRLPHVRPPVLWVFGEKSRVCAAQWRRDYVTSTGTGVGGNGGLDKARVRDVTVKGRGHHVAFEAPAEIAPHAADFVAAMAREWREEKRNNDVWTKEDLDKQTLDKGWIAALSVVPPVKAKM